MILRLRLLITIAACWVCFGAEVVPADRIYSGWPNAGVTGGRPSSAGMTVFSTITTTGDTTDRTSTINSAISSCPSNQVVALGAGTFRCTGTININNEKGVVLRGAGVGVTIIESTASGKAFLMGNGGADWPYSRTGTTLSANEAAGQTVISMSSTTGFDIGDHVRFAQQQNRTPSLLQIRADSTSTMIMTWQTRVTAVNAGVSITILDPLPLDFTTALAAQVKDISAAGFAEMCGIESLTVDCTSGNPDAGIWMWNTYNCWLYDVYWDRPNNQAIYFVEASHCTVEKCIMRGPGAGGSNGAGILCGTEGTNPEPGGSCYLIQNNVCFDFFPGFELSNGFAGSVVAYNAIEATQSAGFFGAGINHHGAHPYMNLYEGNVSTAFEQDGYFGSASHELLAKNRFTGCDSRAEPDAGSTGAHAIELNRFTRQMYVVGNTIGMSQTFWTLTGDTLLYELTANAGNGPDIFRLGFPFIANNGYTGTAEASTGDWWAEWPAGAVAPYSPNTDVDERDLDVTNTLVRKGNYNFKDGAIPAGEALGSDTVADTYYLSGRPPFWSAGLTWPPVWPTTADSVSDLTAAYVAIPAGYRLVNGSWAAEGGSGSSSTFSTQTSGKVTIGGSVTFK